MKCFVTGATGFLGTFLVRELLDQGHEVRAFVRNGSNINSLEKWGVDLVNGNAEKSSDVQKAMEGMDWVFHGAGLMSTWNHEAKEFYTSNVETLRTVVDIASLSQVKKIVYISCCMALGPTGETPLQENSPYRDKRFFNFCHETKYLGHLESTRYCGAGLPYVAVYPGFFYGPGNIDKEPLLNFFIRKGLQGKNFPILGDGSQIINLVYVRDVVRGIIQAAHQGKSGNEYFLGGENITLQRVLETMADISGKTPKNRKISISLAKMFATLDEWMATLTNEPPHYTRGLIDILSSQWVINSDKAKTDLDYQPVSFREGLLKTRETLKYHSADSVK